MHEIRRIRPGEDRLYRSLRLAALKDAPEAFQTTYQEALARGDEQWAVQADGAAAGVDRACFLAFVDDEPAGLASVYRGAGLLAAKGSAAEAELLQVWLAPGARGTGLSRELVMTCIRWSAEVGVRRLVAEVKAGNDRARRFYLGLGFRASGGDGTILELDPRDAAQGPGRAHPGEAL
jgi:GNAT superfamily N-acetyltransferase